MLGIGFNDEPNEETNGSFLNNPEKYLMPLSTKYLVQAYPNAFEEVRVRERSYYIEKSNKNTRGYRYIASTTNHEGDLLNVESLARISGAAIWEKTFTDEDLGEIAKAVALTKIAVEGNNPEVRFDRDIQLADQTSVNVEYVPYIPENTSSITNDLDQDVAE